eukprot:539502-Rhodomonas_salina.1
MTSTGSLSEIFEQWVELVSKDHWKQYNSTVHARAPGRDANLTRKRGEEAEEMLISRFPACCVRSTLASSLSEIFEQWVELVSKDHWTRKQYNRAGMPI